MSTQKLSRRNFLKAAGITVAAATVTCAGLGYVATVTPAFETPDVHFGKEEEMKNRILVTYATRAGSTVEVAAAIGETLSQRGFAVDVKPVKEQPDPAAYQAVILGSAIRIGSWLPEMKEYIQGNQAVLGKLPVAIFTVHGLNTGDDETSRAARQAYTAPIHQLLTPADEVFFAGKIDYNTLSFFDRMMAKAVAKQTGVPSGDYRDWDKIHGWASSVLPQEA